MKTINETMYRTADLRKLFAAGLKHCGASSKRTITVVYSRGRHASGWGAYPTTGWYGVKVEGNRIKMRVPKPHYLEGDEATGSYARENRPWDGETPTQSVVNSIARVFEHEVMHTLGVKHREMLRALRYCTQDVEWAEGLALDVTASKQDAKLLSRLRSAERAREKAYLKFVDLSEEFDGLPPSYGPSMRHSRVRASLEAAREHLAHWDNEIKQRAADSV